MTIRVVPINEEHLGGVSEALSHRDVQRALGLCSQPSRQALLRGEAQTYLGDEGTTHQVRWWVVELDEVPTWAAIEYGWRGALDSSRELALARQLERIKLRLNPVEKSTSLAYFLLPRIPRQIAFGISRGREKKDRSSPPSPLPPRSRPRGAPD